MLVVVEGLSHANIASVAQQVTYELGGSHLALYEDHWASLTLAGHLMKDEISVQVALSMDTNVVFERWLPTIFVAAKTTNNYGFDQFRLMHLDGLVASVPHLGVLVRWESFDSWYDKAIEEGETLPPKETGRKTYDRLDRHYLEYVKGSKMKWLITSPISPIEKIMRHLRKEEDE